MPRRLLWAAVLPLVLASTACDDGVATTARALAWVAAEHLGEPDYATRMDEGPFVQVAGDFVGAELRTKVGDPDRGGEAFPGDALVVIVGTDLEGDDLTTCEGRDAYPYCAPLDGGGALTWTLEDPGEDPGNVMVAVGKGDATAVVILAGPYITADPRTMDLPVSVDQMAELARDERVDLTTTQDAVDAGEALEFWRG